MSTERFIKARTRSSSVGTVIGITLVLLMLGVLGFLLLNARAIEQYFKENIKVEIFLKRDLQEVDIMRFRKRLDLQPFTGQTTYVTPQEAADSLKKDLGEDFLGVLGSNTLKPSIQLRVKESFARPDSLRGIAGRLRQDANVDEVKYNTAVLENIDTNMSKVRWVLAGFSALLLVIAVALINNTIRLAIYSKRFLIRTMHLVGATNWFIKRPFIASSLWQGLIASVLAIGLLVGVVQLFLHYVPDLRMLIDPVTLGALLGAVVTMGLLISLASTWFAVRRYLRMNTDELNWT